MQRPLADHDLYGLLGVHPTASPQEIRLAYRQRAMIWHPDRNKSTDAEETFKLSRSAYEILRDPSRRAAYDRHAGPHLRHSAKHTSQGRRMCVAVYASRSTNSCVAVASSCKLPGPSIALCAKA